MMLVAHWSLTDQPRAQKDIPYLVEQLQVNLLSAMVFMSLGPSVLYRWRAVAKGGSAEARCAAHAA